MNRNILLTAVLTVLATYGCTTGTKTTNESTNTGMNINAMPANRDTGGHGNMDHPSMASSSNAASAPYDLQFLDTMAAHHQGAIDMAIPAETKAQHPEVSKLAKAIIADQKREIDQMKAWREKWFTGAASAINMEMPGMNDSMKGMDMKLLESASGNAFDLAFINQMIPHHEGAVVMAEQALQKSTKPEIKTLAAAIIRAQETEIDEMKRWRANWNK